MDQNKNQEQDARRSKTKIQLTNPSTTEITLTIRCDNPSHLQTYAKWIRHEVEGLTAVTPGVSSQEVTVDYDSNFRGLKAA